MTTYLFYFKCSYLYHNNILATDYRCRKLNNGSSFALTPIVTLNLFQGLLFTTMFLSCKAFKNIQALSFSFKEEDFSTALRSALNDLGMG